ncbi:AsmA family protein [Pseudooceanicola sp. LIPI14-2-Ac024]|uniref:AsmA family protein n=1 Tax=Pseudooceanicola sp. LIPI14-2-Ac024 TaxID=3344875 RepID=UPI0035D058B8
MRVIKWILLAVFAVALVFAGALLFLPGDRIARIAADQIEARTGRAVTLSGGTEVTFWPVLGVRTGPMEIANAAWSDSGPMLRAEGLKIGVEAATLFSDEIRVTEVQAIRPEILLERDTQGRANWDFGGADGAPAGDDAPRRAVHLDRLDVTNATLRMIDGAEETAYRDVDLHAEWPDRTGPVDLSLTLRPAGKPVTLTTQVADLDALLAGQSVPLDLRAEAPGGVMTFSGRAGTAPEAQGRLQADLADPAAFGAALGLGPLALEKTTFTGDVTLSGDRQLAVRDGALRVGANAVQLRADADLRGKPVVNAQVSADRLTLPAASGGGGGGGTGWSTAPIDASALAAFDGEIALSANSIDMGDIVLGPVRSTTRIENARAATEIAQLGAFGGGVTGQFVVNNRAGLSMGGDLTAQGIDLRQALNAAAGVTRITGTGDGRVKFLASGNSMAQLMSSLSGDGSISTGQGTLEGIDLDGLFRAGAVGGGTTIFDSVTASFTMQDGTLANRDLGMRLGSIQATGQGKVGIGTRTIDYLFTPVATTLRGGKGIAVPVRIRGSWDDPSIVPDLEAAVKLNFDEERQALEDKAKAKALDKIGVTRQEGESTEDAIRRRLEQEAIKGLGKLLRGN